MFLIEVRTAGRSKIQKLVRRGHRAWLWLLSVIAMMGCANLLPETFPPTGAPPDVKRLSFAMVARNYRCEPSVLAVDREGRSVLVKLTVRSEGARHIFSIPDFEIRRFLEPGKETTVEFLADRSGIFSFGCTRFPLITPLDHKGKLAIK